MGLRLRLSHDGQQGWRVLRSHLNRLRGRKENGLFDLQSARERRKGYNEKGAGVVPLRGNFDSGRRYEMACRRTLRWWRSDVPADNPRPLGKFRQSRATLLSSACVLSWQLQMVCQGMAPRPLACPGWRQWPANHVTAGNVQRQRPHIKLAELAHASLPGRNLGGAPSK